MPGAYTKVADPPQVGALPALDYLVASPIPYTVELGKDRTRTGPAVG